MLGLLVLQSQSGGVAETAEILTVSGVGQRGDYEVKGKVVLIQGNSSRITLRGAPKRIEVSGNNHSIQADGTATVIVGGNGNRLTIKGLVTDLKINGTTNRVSVAHLTRVSVAGVENIVRWQKGPNGGKPKASISGVDNRVVRG
jgi:hypothetical protein